MKIVLTLIFLGLCACASTEYERKMKAYQQQYGSLMGKTENEVVEAKGAPTDIIKAGDYITYIYYISHGFRGRGHESFDQGRIYFKDGKSVKWDADWRD